MKKIIIISCILTLLLCPALAAGSAQNELDALVWISKVTGYGFLLGEPAWEQQEWYAYWLENFGLSGNYEPCKDSVSWEEENELSEIAYRDWAEQCGITNENDFSEASMLYYYTHTDNGVKRELALVQRCHGGTGLEDEHDFYTLIDRADKTILARSDVEKYMAFLRHAEAWKKEWEAGNARLITLAKETVAERFSKREMPTTLEMLADYDAEVAEAFDYGDTYRVYLTPKGKFASEFTVVISKTDEKASVESWAGDDYPRYTQAELDRVLAAYDRITAEYYAALEQAGGIDHMTLEQRAALGDSIRDKLAADDGELNLWYGVVTMKKGSHPVWNDPLVWDAALPTEKDITENAAIENAILDINVFDHNRMPDALQGVEFTAYFLKGDIWAVIGSRKGQEVYRVDLDSRTSKPLYAAKNVDGEWRDLIYDGNGEGLEGVLGDFGEWSILEKYRYGGFYNNLTYYGIPDETEMQPDEALRYAKEQLTQVYPDLTMEMLDAAVVCPYFYEPRTEALYGQVYDKDVYYFSFDLDPASGNRLTVYEIIFDAADGTVHVTNDPLTAGNG